MSFTTVVRRKVNGQTYRLANLGYARGFAIQILQGKSYQTVEHLGWVTERDARAFFHEFCEI